MENQIVYIKTELLSPHPCNPRQNLGDLTELAESIRIKGVMQNLTVVPHDGEYRIVIGHRRAAAAMLAGVEEVPCIISTMTQHEQVETMLLENMQRSDLTVLEQANGFQMMLDFGESIESISKKTGFSESTVRRRVKLMELDQKKLAKAVARGGSLMDYMELDKIEDPEQRNKVLDAIGTANFNSTLMRAIDDQEKAGRIQLWISDFAQYAHKIDKKDFLDGEPFAMDYVNSVGNWEKTNTVKKPEDADTVCYFYTVNEQTIALYRAHQDKKETPEWIQQREREAKSKEIEQELRSIAKRHYELRSDFVKSFKGEKKHLQDIVYFTAVSIFSDGEDREWIVNEFIVEKLFGISITVDMDYSELYKKLRDPLIKARPEYALLAVVYGSMDHEQSGYYESRWMNTTRTFVYQENADLDRIYELLQALGYEMSDEERFMQDGTHPLLFKEEEDEEDNE